MAERMSPGLAGEHPWSNRLADWAAGSLDEADAQALEAALQIDPDLRAEADLVAALRATRPEPNRDLAERITARALHAEAAPAPTRSGGSSRGLWRYSTAAVLVLALGTALVWQATRGPADLEGVAVSEPGPDSWIMDDGIVAEAPVLDDLTERELNALLAELEG